jgi:hypothetical protein
MSLATPISAPAGTWMNALAKRRWLLASIALGLIAIGFEFASKKATAKSVMTIARKTQALNNGVASDVLESMTEQSRAALDRGNALGLIGMGLAAASAICLVVSNARQEKGWRLLAATVVIAYVLWYLVLV